MYYLRRTNVSSSHVVLFAADILFIVGSIFLAAILRLSLLDGLIYIKLNYLPLIGASLIYLLVIYIGGLYERDVLSRQGSSIMQILTVVFCALVIIILVFYARFTLHIGRGILSLSGIFVFCGIWVVRHLMKHALGRGVFTKNTLIVGNGKAVKDIVQLLSVGHSGYKLLGIITNKDAKNDNEISNLKILGDLPELSNYVSTNEIETIIVAAHLNSDPKLLKSLRPLRYAGVEVIDYVGLHEELAQEIPLSYVDDEWLMFAAMNSSRIHIRQIKRLMDVFVSVIGLLVLAPVGIVSMLLIKLTTSGPVFYSQERVGRDGVPYTLLKLRTMRNDAETGSGAVWAKQNDDRITPIGSFLRKWRIDEIPQLINVLRGQMSLVGPRPERPTFVDMLNDSIPFYGERLLVAPGITGWAQVKYPYASSIEASERKLQYDLYYIKHMSFFLDVLILLKTFRTIIIGIRYDTEFLTEEVENS